VEKAKRKGPANGAFLICEKIVSLLLGWRRWWRTVIAAVSHVAVALLLHLVEFGFLVVGEDGANLGIGFLVNVAHLGTRFFTRGGGIVHGLRHLIALILEDGFDLGLLGIGQVEPGGEVLELIIDGGHVVRGTGASWASATWRRTLLGEQRNGRGEREQE
jgi:hypothetical protein